MTKPKGRRVDSKQSQKKKGTLDQKHTERLTRFEKLDKSLPLKKERLCNFEQELGELMSTNPNKFTHEDIRRKAHLMDVIDKLKTEIVSIENCTEPLNYIVKVLPTLVHYYDNEDIIDDGIEEELVVSGVITDGGKKNILTYFMQANEITTNPKEKSEPTANSKSKTAPKSKSTKKTKPVKKSNSKTAKKTTAESSPIPKSKISRAKLYENYLNIIDVAHRKLSNGKTSKCYMPGCDGEKILSQSDGYMVCKKCGVSDKIFTVVEKPNYKEPTQDSGTYAYKRINHLTEILSQLQAKESTDIPPRVFESVSRELKKRKINKDDLDIFYLRKILKKLNLRKYYEHVPHILQIINKKEPPNFSRRDEMRIKKMFKDIQKPFAIYCPPERKNFLNYSYVLHKFCELLGLDDYIDYFPLLKNNAKLRQHDKIWSNICKYMRWKFYKSI